MCIISEQMVNGLECDCREENRSWLLQELEEFFDSAELEIPEQGFRAGILLARLWPPLASSATLSHSLCVSLSCT